MAGSRWKRHIMVNSMQANEAPIWTCLQAALAQRACMELTTTRRFQRL